MGPLGWACLFSASVCCAQSSNRLIAQTNLTQADSATRIESSLNPMALDDGTVLPLDNVATASLERTLARAVALKFSPLEFVDDEESADDELPDAEVAFGRGILLAQVQENPPAAGAPGATKPAEPTLGDLGFPTGQTQGSAQDQARLDKRAHMLKIHQRLGLITTVPLVLSLFTGSLAGGKSTSSTNRLLHAALGGDTAGMYLTTAYFAIFAPKIPGTKARGPIRVHKFLAFIHGPGMILTPILGAMAFDQKSSGEKVHGIASAHGAVAAITGIAYGLAIVSVSVHF